jgi:hypothetical protein
MLNKYYIPIIGFILFIINSEKYQYSDDNSDAPVNIVCKTRLHEFVFFLMLLLPFGAIMLLILNTIL